MSLLIPVIVSWLACLVFGFWYGDKQRSIKQMPPRHVHDFGPWEITKEGVLKLVNSDLDHGRYIEQRRVCALCKYMQIDHQQWDLLSGILRRKPI
jgi:hypothetical protein